jgi:hypothetical protein
MVAVFLSILTAASPVFAGEKKSKPPKLNHRLIVSKERPMMGFQPLPVDLTVRVWWEQDKQRLENGLPVGVVVIWGDGSRSEQVPGRVDAEFQGMFHFDHAYRQQDNFQLTVVLLAPEFNEKKQSWELKVAQQGSQTVAIR